MSEQERYVTQVWKIPVGQGLGAFAKDYDLDAFAKNVGKVTEWINEMAAKGYELAHIHETNMMSISGTTSTWLGTGNGRTQGGTDSLFWTVIVRRCH